MTTMCRDDYHEPGDLMELLQHAGRRLQELPTDAESVENLERLCESQQALLAEQASEIAHQRDEIRHLTTRRVNLLLIVGGLAALGGYLLRGWAL